MISKRLAVTLGAGLIAVGAAAPAHAATFTVNNTNDAGPGSLRSQISAAEQTATRDQIRFEIEGDGIQTITLAGALPTLTQPLTIKGYTQPGATAATDAAPASPKIVIDAAAAFRGLDIGGDGMDVRGLVIQNAQETGIYVEGEDNVIAGNHIGTTAGGNGARPNGLYGVRVIGQDNVIGGPAAADRNLISSNGIANVWVSDGSGHVVEGNRIGTNAAGTAALGGFYGVQLDRSGASVRDNLISGHAGAGVVVNADDNSVQGNSIGTDVAGAASLANGFGVQVRGGDNNMIGGTAEGDGNLVSGNSMTGIRLEPGDDGAATGNDVQGNLVGTTQAGDAPLPNGTLNDYPGVAIVASNGNVVGGTDPAAANVISGNDGDGVRIRDAGADGNRVLGNFIGTDPGGADLGNGLSGVSIEGGDENRIGDDADPGNTIAHNGDDGVTVESGDGNSVLRNSIRDNTNLGIDLGADGPTENDPNDIDTGANGLQNGPEIQSATTTGVEWELDSQQQTIYRLEFFSCDRAGAGEGETFLGATTMITDANGNADDTTPLAVPAGDVTMTATASTFGGVFPNLSLIPHETSEFAPCEEVA
jgi:hypothetical protein